MLSKFITIEQALKKKTGEVSVRGWVYRERKHRDKVFIVLRDSTEIIQAVISDKSKAWKEANRITMESSVTLKGKLKQDKRAPTGYEIAVSELEIVGLAEPFPIGRDLSEEFLLDVRHLALRSRKLTASLKIRSTVLGVLHNYLRKQGFIEAEAPSFNEATSEGGSEVFELDYYGKKAFLTQSWQFYAENFIPALEKVYAMAPSFRAERSKTRRHLTEFWHCEVEKAWCNMDEMIKLGEECIIESVKAVLKSNKKELKILGVEDHLKKIKAPFPRITYEQAIKTLNKNGFRIKYGQDFGAREEKGIAKLHNNFVVVTNYPLEILKFYHGEDLKNPGTGTNFNFFAPDVGEVLDGSEREIDIEKIKKRLRKAKIDLGTSDWYLDSRRYGNVPHSGFGLGTERLVQWICKLDSIRDAIPFPRTPTRIHP
ncbi:MAG: asparagine--tRNA ligase [archaeon]|nr:MAG: asparagine--tRNA ligase [archaeon]